MTSIRSEITIMPTNCSWNRKISNAQERFRVFSEFNNEAVLDRETGLVWERTPSTQTLQWPNARLLCAQKGGGRDRWRLPAFNELSSLVDPAVQNVVFRSSRPATRF